MDGRISSPWNVILIKLLAEEAIAVRDGIPAITWPYSASHSIQAYYENLVKDEIERARTTWKKAQPKRLASGGEETPTQTQNRVARAKDMRDKSARRTSRRIAVR
jgi:hypothetical protein